MKRAIVTSFLMSLFALPALADGLIDVPKGADEEEVKKSTKLYDHGDIPSGNNIEDYVRWAKGLIEAGRKNHFAALAYKTPTKSGARCLWFAGAFGFQQVSKNRYEMNCFAGTPRKITHVVFYKMDFSYQPDGCADESKIREFFKPEGLRNRTGAMQFINMLNNTCALKYDHTDREAPVQRAVKLDPEDVEKELNKPERESLRLYVNRSKDKKSSGASGFTNPLRGSSGGDATDSAE